MVTPDGNFVTANTTTNSDLFWAIRGGGGSKFGVVTSVIMKAYEPVPMGFAAPVLFSTRKIRGLPYVPLEKFWDAILAYHQFVPGICGAGGIGFTMLTHIGNAAFSTPPTTALAAADVQYLTALEARDAKVDPDVSALMDPAPMAYPSRSAGAMNYYRLTSRLFPRANFEDETLLNQTICAMKTLVVEGSYTIHGNTHCPTLDVAGNPNNAVLPAYPNTAMHTQAWEKTYAIGLGEVQKKENERFQSYFQKWRDVSPKAGSYMNEADAGEPGWQWAYYEENYERLLAIKKKWDPWDVLWANTAVRSEGWEVRTPVPGWPAQNGRLCHVEGEKMWMWVV